MGVRLDVGRGSPETVIIKRCDDPPKPHPEKVEPQRKPGSKKPPPPHTKKHARHPLSAEIRKHLPSAEDLKHLRELLRGGPKPDPTKDLLKKLCPHLLRRQQIS